MNDYLLDVLLNQRTDDDLYTLYQLLKENNVKVVKRLGAKLLADANGSITINIYAII